MTALNAWPAVTSITPLTTKFIVDINTTTTAITKSILGTNVMKSFFASVTDPVLFKSDDGINFDTAAGDDGDIDILTLDVTGTPKLWWDESVDAFSLSKPLFLGGVQTTASVDPYVNVNRAVDGATNNSGHCFSDSSTVTRGNGTAAATALAYNSFDARITVSGTENYNHFAAFQAAPTLNTSGTTTKYYGLYSLATVSAGTLTDSFGVYVAASAGAGAVTNDYGIYIATHTKGATLNYAIYSGGSAPSHFVGNIGIGNGTAPQTNTRLYIGGSSAVGNVNNQGISIEHTYTGTYLTGINVLCATAGSSAISGVFSMYCRPNHGSSSTLESFYGIYSAPTSSGGATANLYHTYIADAAGSGAFTNQYGVYVAALAKGGTLNYAIYTAGATPSCLEGPLHFINVAAPTTLTNGCAIYATDQAAGNSCVHAKTEGGAIIKLYQQAHIADFAGDGSAAVNAILVALENCGLLAAA
jgi:hypothetical protein